MQMNKNQMTMAVIGGVALLGALVLGYLIYDEGDAQDKAQRDLNNHTSRYNQNKNATVEQREAYEANEAAAVAWATNAYGVVAAQDARLYGESITAESLLQKMQAAREAYLQQPEGEGVTVKFIGKDFWFGKYFQPYVEKGNPIAKDKQAEIQRRWGDVCQLADILLKSGVRSLEDVVVVEPEETPAPEPQYGASSDEPKAETYPVQTETYKLTFKASPVALATALNAFSAEKRFISVDAMSFSQDGDPLIAKFGGAQKSEKQGRRRRRGADQQEDEDGEKKQVGLITDPEQELVPFTVTMTLSTLTAKEVK